MKLKQQQAKKRLTINICRFMRTLKFTANTNTKKPPVHITPRAAVKINTSVFQKKEIHKKWYFVWENSKISIDMYCG